MKHGELSSVTRRLALILSLLLLATASVGAEKPAAATKSERASVGLQVVPIATGELVVLGVLPKSSAQQAGLAPGDLLIAVDGNKLRGSRFEDVAKKYLWGKPGSKVKATYLRPGVAGEKTAQLTRAALPNDAAQNLELRMLEPAPAEAAGVKP